MSRLARVKSNDDDHLNISWTTRDGYIVSIVEDKRRLEVWVWKEGAPNEREQPRAVGDIAEVMEVATEWLKHLRDPRCTSLFNPRWDLEDTG